MIDRQDREVSALNVRDRLYHALWRIYRRPGRPVPWAVGGNLPWDDADFSRRMLREHLDESHGAASRTSNEQRQQIDWLWNKLNLESGHRLLDMTCGPGLYAVEFADRGCTVVGVDFGPASIAHARELAGRRGVAQRCTFVEMDVREWEHSGAKFHAAIFLYGQLAVFTRQEARSLLTKTAKALETGGRLCVELLHQDRVDKADSNWWFTDDKGLWGNVPFLHLGERIWYPDEELSLERYQIVCLETGELTEIQLCDQTYSTESMSRMMKDAGFSQVGTYPDWDGLPLYDASEWVVYCARR